MIGVRGRIVAENLVETLEDVASQLKLLAVDPGVVAAEDALFFAEVLGQAAKVAAVANMQREEMENRISGI